MRLGHNAHAHPLYELEGCETSFVAEEGDHGTGQLFVAIELRATDGGGAGGLPPLTGRDEIRIDTR